MNENIIQWIKTYIFYKAKYKGVAGYSVQKREESAYIAEWKDYYYIAYGHDMITDCVEKDIFYDLWLNLEKLECFNEADGIRVKTDTKEIEFDKNLELI